MDLWEWKLKNSKEIVITLDLIDFDFNTWDNLSKSMEDEKSRKKIIKEGELLLKYQKVLVEDVIRNNGQMVEFEGYKIFAVNSSVFTNEVGHSLSMDYPPFGIIWKQRPNIITVSLRSDGTVDVGAIAKKYGG